MAALSDAMDGLSINTSIKKPGLDDDLQTKLNEIKNIFETVFSWKIKEQMISKDNLLIDFIDKIQLKLEVNMNGDDKIFNLHR